MEAWLLPFETLMFQAALRGLEHLVIDQHWR
jgi:hypothetical protein